MATRTHTETAVQIWVLTAFSEVSKNHLMRRCCLSHWKNSSTRQRALYSAQMVAAGKVNWLVMKTGVLPGPSSAIVGSQMIPVVRSSPSRRDAR